MQNRSAIILAAYALGAVAVRIEDYDYVWNDVNVTEQDTTWPEDHCCRLYRNMEFRIRKDNIYIPTGEVDWMDVCYTNPGTEGTEHTDLSDTELNDEVQSYKCGYNTAIRFCVNADGVRCDQFYESESGAGRSESQDLGLHDQHTSISLTWYDPLVTPAATVYSMTDCHGHQSIIWMDAGESSTGDKYANLHDRIDLPNWAWYTQGDIEECMADPPGIHSVLLPKGEGYWMQLFNDPDFEGQHKTVDETRLTYTECNNFTALPNNFYCSGALASSLIFGQRPGAEPIDPEAEEEEAEEDVAEEEVVEEETGGKKKNKKNRKKKKNKNKNNNNSGDD